MFIRTILGALIAAVVVFVWGYVYWMILPFSGQVMKTLENESIVAADLKENIPESGVYVMPAPPSDLTDVEAREDFEQRHQDGPVVSIFFSRNGQEPMGTKTMVLGFLQIFAATIAAGIALSATDVFVYPGRVMIILWMGVFCALFTSLSDVVWWYHPMELFWLKTGYIVSSALLMGLILAAFIRPPAPQAE